MYIMYNIQCVPYTHVAKLQNVNSDGLCYAASDSQAVMCVMPHFPVRKKSSEPFSDGNQPSRRHAHRIFFVLQESTWKSITK